MPQRQAQLGWEEQTPGRGLEPQASAAALFSPTGKGAGPAALESSILTRTQGMVTQPLSSNLGEGGVSGPENTHQSPVTDTTPTLTPSFVQNREPVRRAQNSRPHLDPLRRGVFPVLENVEDVAGSLEEPGS